jgi:hypothetical protein
MRFFIKETSIVLITVMNVNCATMFHGSSDQISIRSKEPGTTIYIDEAEVGTDNAVHAVPKKGNHTIRVSKSGCTDRSVPIKYSFDGVSLLGVLLDLGIISILMVDGIGTGAVSKADQTNYILSPKCPGSENVAQTRTQNFNTSQTQSDAQRVQIPIPYTKEKSVPGSRAPSAIQNH